MINIYRRLTFLSLFLITLLITGELYAAIHSFTSASVLASGKFVKIRVKDTGIYKLTYEDLNAMGVNPASVRIFGYGGGLLPQSFKEARHDDLPEVAIYMEKGSDGVFNSGDYILFYAQGIVSWKFDSARSYFYHQPHHYANYGHYFVSSDAGTGRTINLAPEENPGSLPVNRVTTFTDFTVHENDLYSLTNSGKEFYGEMFMDVLQLSLKFNFPNSVKEPNAVKVRLDVAASSVAVSDFRLSLAGGQEKRLQVASRSKNDTYEKGRDANAIFQFQPEADLLDFQLSYTKTVATGKGYLNYLSVNARRQLKHVGSWMRFQNIDHYATNTYNTYTLSDAGSNVKVWDITDPVSIQEMKTTRSGNELTFTASAKSLRSFVALDVTAAYPKPEIVGVVPNQNLHAMEAVDMLIITHPRFLQQANKLADAHNAMGEVKAGVVTTEQVYNEFSSGNPDATAYRWVLKMLYDRAIDQSNPDLRPKSVLLFGRGSFNNRNLPHISGTGLVLTYQTEYSLSETLSYVSDDYFTLLEDHEGTRVDSESMDMGVGRFPVTTVQEANDVVNKTIAYMQNTRKGMWKNQICYLADDGDGALHMRDADSVAVRVARSNPAYQINKIYLDAYQQSVNASGESYPVARAQFHNLLRNGMLFLNYVGHAGVTGWTNEQILSTADVKSLSNQNLPLWVGATCDFLQFDNLAVSAGEYVLLNPVGGGIAIISAARPVYASQNKHINQRINQFLFQKENGQHLRLGEVLRRAKNSLGTETNKLSYILVGDPSVRLNYPDEYQVVAQQLNGRIISGNDTLRALSVATIKGIIADADGTKQSSFSGKVYADVFDKVQKIQTLDNDKNGSMTYYDRPNRLFSGLAEIHDGEFEITFAIPRDIKYNYGGGRINFYAEDTTMGFEAQGILESFTIGGSDENADYETEGPQIEMYLNVPSFVSGDRTNETPLFVANVSDPSGINQVGSGIGHDITLIVDDNPDMIYTLNDYYTTTVNDYTSGQVRFKLPELKSGKHTLKFRVWDLLNNSSTQELEFEVVKGLEPVIFRISNYPNPVTTSTRFVIEHDRPETVLSTRVDVYDVAGKRVWTFNQATIDEIYWDMSDGFGRQLTKGVYLYRIIVSTGNGQVESKLNKLILTD
ncbi:MAG: type IX secretion system sortase PorU [Paludibacter sp.]|nr:type IX secretion system sortase PorU [Paludibacter sp.]